jgi:hypothetical protein
MRAPAKLLETVEAETLSSRAMNFCWSPRSTLSAMEDWRGARARALRAAPGQ